jgi:putative transposase
LGHEEEDDYVLTLRRYVEANPLHAGMVGQADEWQWSGLWGGAEGQESGDGLVLSAWPVKRPRNWTARVDAHLGAAQLASVRECVDRGRPSGNEQRVAETARRLALDFTLRGPGRPRRQENL